MTVNVATIAAICSSIAANDEEAEEASAGGEALAFCLRSARRVRWSASSARSCAARTVWASITAAEARNNNKWDDLTAKTEEEAEEGAADVEADASPPPTEGCGGEVGSCWPPPPPAGGGSVAGDKAEAGVEEELGLLPTTVTMAGTIAHSSSTTLRRGMTSTSVPFDGCSAARQSVRRGNRSV